MTIAEPPKRLLYLGLLIAVFLINDLPLMQTDGYIQWVLLDYAIRLLVIVEVVYLVKQKGASLADFGLVAMPWPAAIKWSLLLTVVGIFVDQVVWKFFELNLPPTKMMSFPAATSPLLNIVDLTFGLLWVSLSEELVFRGYFRAVAQDYLKNPAAVIALSSVAFGLIHWSLGLHAVITTAIWGILPMLVALKTGSIVPALVSHYLTNLVGFSGIVPEYLLYYLKL